MQRFRKAMLLATTTVLAVAFTSAQRTSPTTTRPAQIVEGARPVATAMARVASQLEWNITYEDPPYVNGAELRDVTRRVIDGRRLVVPRGGRVLLPENLEALAARQDPVTLLESITATEQTTTGTVNRFEIQRSKRRFHVVPRKFLDADGQWRKLMPILDTHIRLSHGEVNLFEFMDVLCEAVTAVRGMRVRAGRIPANFGLKTKLPPQRRAGPARGFLLKALDSPPHWVSWSWLLFYDPSGQTYYLHVVPPGTD